MKYQFQIGDEFKFIPIKGRNKRLRCLEPDRTFIIHEISKPRYIKYFDKRTNKKCKCQNCSRQDYSSYNYSTGEIETTKGLKSCHESEIQLIRTKSQRQREILLKLLNI